VQQCGWFKDKFGLTWQVVLSVLGELMQVKDPQTCTRVMEALLQMVKLHRAAQGGTCRARTV
jgi:predicted 3-demethylubiquinone-9 3-methyltransferase (glyoxalase superfamily)